MELNLTSLLLSLVLAAISVAISFYLKEYFQKKTNYKKFKEKLNAIAGKRSQILYALEGKSAPELFEIIEIDKTGVTLKNDLHTVYVPVSHIVNKEIILPCKDYDNVKLEKAKIEIQKVSKELMPAMFNELFPAIMNATKEHLLEEMLEEEGEVSAVIGVKIQKVLSEEGYEIKKKLNSDKK